MIRILHIAGTFVVHRAIHLGRPCYAVCDTIEGAVALRDALNEMGY
jgi:hypothetical protein